MNATTYAPFTIEYAMHACDVHENEGRDSRGKCRKWRRNGATQMWKRDPQRFAFGAKFGLYSYYRFTNSDANAIHCACQCANH